MYYLMFEEKLILFPQHEFIILKRNKLLRIQIFNIFAEDSRRIGHISINTSNI